MNNQPYTKSDLERDKAVIAATPPSPWIAPDTGFDIVRDIGNGYLEIIVQGCVEGGDTCDGSNEELYTIHSPEVREFIVAARNNFPRALAALEQAWGEVERLKSQQADLVYLASPYSHPDPAMREARFQAVCRHAAKLMRDGLVVYSPIAHMHPVAQYGLPKGWAFWERYDRVMLGVCRRMIVLTLDGWKESTGVAAEIAIMDADGKPVEYQEPDTGAFQ